MDALVNEISIKQKNNISKKSNLVSMSSKVLYIFQNNKDVYMDLHTFRDKFNLEFPDERIDSNKASILLSNFYLSNYIKEMCSSN